MSDAQCSPDDSYIVLQLGLAGPLLQVTRTVLSEVRTRTTIVTRTDGKVKRIGTDRLRESFADGPAVRQGESSSNSSSDARRNGDLVGEKLVEK